MDFSTLPKVELHLHLDNSLSFAAVSRLDPSVTLPDYQRDFILPAKCLDMAEFFACAPRGSTLMQTEEQLRFATFDVFEQLRRDNVLYAEILLFPYLHTSKGLAAENVVEIVDEAMAQANQEMGIEARIILSVLRHYTTQQSLATVKLVERFKGTHVAGIDLGGYEAAYPIFAHIPAFQYAAQHGIPRTVHAGEMLGAESVWDTLKHLHPSRISHGVRSIEDPVLLEHLRKEQIHLEVCPTSNVQLDLYKTYAHHPINRFYESGMAVSVNTDTRTMTNVTLMQEYEQLHQVFGWKKEHFFWCNLNALHAAFLPEDMKSRLEQRLRMGYGMEGSVRMQKS
jgi:adenosine deaminase